MSQSRWNSPVLKTGLATLLVFAIKEITGYELPTTSAEIFFYVLFVIINAVAQINNPKDKKHI
jgi:hypothetical protein